MQPFSTLSRYIGRQFLVSFLGLLLLLLLLIVLLDAVELLRRAAGKSDVTVMLVIQMAFLKLPGIGQQMFPFAVLYSAMFTFWKMTRSHELVVARASGVSVWQFMMPVLVMAIVIGGVRIAIINPIGAALIAKYDRLEERYLKGKANTFEVTRSGLWLRQINEDRQYLIHADVVNVASSEMQGILVLMFDKDDKFVGRIDAGNAKLSVGFWEIRDGWLNRSGKPTELVKVERIPTDLTMARIEESFARPQTISFWQLPHFISLLEKTGFSAVRHRLHFQSLLAQPLLYCAMVLLAAAFSLRHTRRGGVMWMVVGGVLAGFTLFIVTDVVLTFGISEAIPVFMAAWFPTAVSLLQGTAALFHLEDG
ncbi:lipopolysaccharide export system permease protein [Azospirillaceae bacterium]